MIGRDEQEDQLETLRKEVDQLRQALVSHVLVDQAIGVVTAVGRLHPEQGWGVLKHVSQHTNVKLREVARCLVEWPSSGRLPEVIRRALPAAMEHARAGTDGDHGYDPVEVHCDRPA
ncbi:ANTAR domain-containing protein [Streptomyces actinomycinicus]|uniref:ANTAR domain-containing protein n=1 Tax=Streptomyces actinomycinicus TaxID=1695166 RepID=A0A937JQN0_9ACTN|nr:ANTAR domain-containing protein [Streptomyces actinomycinicus]MBL1086875.1 ANTAR domain-containing protein [Streptomyces actinomycinicus]